jgi:hypothetical protein
VTGRSRIMSLFKPPTVTFFPASPVLEFDVPSSGLIYRRLVQCYMPLTYDGTEGHR